MARTEIGTGSPAGTAPRRRAVPRTSGVGEDWGRPGSDLEGDQQDLFRGFLDVPIEVGVQLGQKFVKFREVLELQVDSVIRLQRSAGENVDLLLENQPVGRGEIVVIEDLMGLRITDLAETEGEVDTEEDSEDA